MIERDEIHRLQQQRKDARQILRSDGQKAKELLKPSAIFDRWKETQLDKLSSATESGKVIAKRSFPFVGGAAVGALIFAGRKPIISAVRKIRNKES